MSVETAAVRFPFPPQGAALPADKPLPLPEIISANAAEIRSQHGVAIFTSDDETMGESVRTLAVQLHTNVFLKEGFIGEEELNGVGLYVDGYSSRSEYFYAVNGNKIAAARQIPCAREGILAKLHIVTPPSEVGLRSLPTIKNFEIDPQAMLDVAHARTLADINPGKVKEISGLASRVKEGATDESHGNDLDAVLGLYTKMLARSLENGDEVWIQNVSPGFVRLLRNMVGEDQVRELGPKREYMGPASVPVAFNLHDATRHVLVSDSEMSSRLRTHFRVIFQGMDDRKVPADIRKLFAENDIQTESRSRTRQALANPKFLACAAITAYSSVRAFPAASVEQFHGSLPVLLGIDVGTAIPYGPALIEAATGRNLPRRLGAAAAAGALFLAPYAYYYKEGSNYPPAVNWIAGSLIGAAIAKELIGRKAKHAKNERLLEDLCDIPVDKLPS
ncbi:MAG TPA: hypothetical protein VIM53_00175 [Candidatus Saccharimonadales bacterium]